MSALRAIRAWLARGLAGPKGGSEAPGLRHPGRVRRRAYGAEYVTR
ncbi:hypothetical protein BN2475_250036 [Paraburkholderia ribeironis]|uniref:Uncharacterized protein n=1 Tax=Paraburkholderia ribeironis TaxID=1247936 RepID=A0A1N7RYJ8_9BURK|nr:hypothetical protein BN2475_250036 [Paraburkholderia ribeironis]